MLHFLSFLFCIRWSPFISVRRAWSQKMVDYCPHSGFWREGVQLSWGVRVKWSVRSTGVSRTGLLLEREPSQKAKPLIYQSSYDPTLTDGHELWVVTKRIRSRTQAAEMSFLWGVAGLGFRHEEKGWKPLLHHSQRSQFRWFWASAPDPRGRLPLKVFLGMFLLPIFDCRLHFHK